jgi:hypothetical protein
MATQTWMFAGGAMTSTWPRKRHGADLAGHDDLAPLLGALAARDPRRVVATGGPLFTTKAVKPR